MLTALSVSRERELGTFDQTLVSPATPFEIALGKLLPPLLVAFVQTSLYLVLVTQLYGVPFRESIPLFYASVLTFAAACAGIWPLHLIHRADSAAGVPGRVRRAAAFRAPFRLRDARWRTCRSGCSSSRASTRWLTCFV